jgi:hypothetical protein
MGVGLQEESPDIGSIVDVENIAPRLPVQDTTNDTCPNLLRGHEEYRQ